MMRGRRLFCTVMALPWFLVRYAWADPVIDVPKIAGKLDTEVAAELGQPTSCKPIVIGTRCTYQQGNTEIVYIQDRADWITINNLSGVPFSGAALTALGLPDKEPTVSNQYQMSWDGIAGLRSVQVFPAGSTIDHAYIKAVTP